MESRGIALAPGNAILVLSLAAVKKNLGAAASGVFDPSAASQPELRHDADKTKKSITLLCRANGLRSWASLNLSKKIGIRTNKNSKLGRFLREPTL